jgi:hypothetical protein
LGVEAAAAATAYAHGDGLVGVAGAQQGKKAGERAHAKGTEGSSVGAQQRHHVLHDRLHHVVCVRAGSSPPVLGQHDANAPRTAPTITHLGGSP